MDLGVAPSGAAKTELRFDIQALRGFAVLVVVLYHAGVSAIPAGYLGVDIFFVISGFLITGLIAKGIEARSFSFTSFYYRRAKRLLPAAYVVLALTLLAAPFFVTQLVLDDLRMQILGAVTFTSNFVFWQQAGYFDSAAETKPLLHFWSLSLEEQYYLLMPALLAFTPRKAWLPIVAAILVGSAALNAYMLTVDTSGAFYLLPTRAWQLALGSLGALVGARVMGARALSWARLPALIALFAIPAFPLGGPHPGLDSAIVCVSTLILILGATGGKIEASAPVRAFAWVGHFSYALYLVHWPVLVLMRARWPEAPDWAPLAAVAVSIAISLLLYWVVEEPFRRGFFKARRPLTFAMATASALIVAGGLYVTAPGNAWSAVAAALSPATDSLANADFAHIFRNNYGLGPECAADDGRTFADTVGPCRTRPHPRVVLWGDSNAMMWGAALGRQLGEAGLLQATRPSCAPMYQLAVTRADDDTTSARSQTVCLTFNEAVLDYIRDTPSIEVVVLATSFTQPAMHGRRIVLQTRENGEVARRPLETMDPVVQSYASLARELRRVGKRVVIIGPIPFAPRDHQQCQERLIRGQTTPEEGDCNFTVAEWRHSRDTVLSFVERMAREADIEVVWPTAAICAERVCRTRIGDTLVYRDRDHLSFDGADYVADELDLSDRLLAAAR